MKTRKILAILLTLAMLMGLLCTSAMATDPYNLPVDSGASVTTIQASGASITGVQHTTTVLNEVVGNKGEYYNIVLNSNTPSDAVITLNFTKPDANVISPVPPSGHPQVFRPMILANANTTFTVTLSGGVASTTLYVHKDFSNYYGKCDSYVFNFTTSAAPTPTAVLSDSNTGLTMRFGDPNYTQTAPECFMYFANSGSPYDVIYSGPLTGYYPDSLAFYITSGASTISAMDGGNAVYFIEFDATGAVTNYASTPSASALHDGFYALRILEAGYLTITAGGQDVVLYFDDPASATGGGSAVPCDVKGYLPGMGQFSNNTNWGSISTDGQNSLSDLSIVKGPNGYVTPGISLGSLGGYVVYDFSTDPITDDPANPYGVDFIVYGNAFSGNPEAAAVQVYGIAQGSQTPGWYELAGSRYYEAGTVRNATVRYESVSGNAYLNNTVQSAYGSHPAWYPAFNSMNHPTTSLQGNALNSAYVTYSDTALTFYGVTSIADSNDHSYYAYGYADVTPNGNNVIYGEPTNPYLAAANKTGGDGFDLAWAVDIATGLPVKLTSVSYVRVYSAVLYNAGILGETSAEICGIYKVETEASAQSVGVTTAPTIYFNGMTAAEWAAEEVVIPSTVINGITVYDASGIIEADSVISATGATGTNIIVNNSANSHTIGNGESMVRVIAQAGDAAPSISLIVF